jgi:hypothetical protein
VARVGTWVNKDGNIKAWQDKDENREARSQSVNWGLSCD